MNYFYVADYIGDKVEFGVDDDNTELTSSFKIADSSAICNIINAVREKGDHEVNNDTNEFIFKVK